MLVLILVFEMGEVVVVVEFLLVYPLALYFLASILVWHSARLFGFVLISLSQMCLVMDALQSCEWEFIWYTLCRQSLKQNPLISHHRQACLGWLKTLCPDKLVSSSVSKSLQLLSVDSFWTLEPLLFLDFFLEGWSRRSSLLEPLVVLVSMASNLLKLWG